MKTALVVLLLAIAACTEKNAPDCSATDPTCVVVRPTAAVVVEPVVIAEPVVVAPVAVVAVKNDAKRIARNAAKIRAANEAAAYAKAEFNAKRALCLGIIVDLKIMDDISLGRIRDYEGTALQAPTCQPAELADVSLLRLQGVRQNLDVYLSLSGD